MFPLRTKRRYRESGLGLFLLASLGGRVWGLTPGLGRSEGTQKQQDQRGETPYSQVLFSKVSDSPDVQSLTLDERMKYCTVHSAGRYRVYTDAIMEY